MQIKTKDAAEKGLEEVREDPEVQKALYHRAILDLNEALDKYLSEISDDNYLKLAEVRRHVMADDLEIQKQGIKFKSNFLKEVNASLAEKGISVEEVMEKTERLVNMHRDETIRENEIERKSLVLEPVVEAEKSKGFLGKFFR